VISPCLAIFLSFRLVLSEDENVCVPEPDPILCSAGE
jgi:hypothetical protein